MSSLLSLTNLPKTRKEFLKEALRAKGGQSGACGYKNYNGRDDYMTFITSSNATDLNQDSNAFYNNTRQLVIRNGKEEVSKEELANKTLYKQNFFNSTPDSALQLVTETEGEKSLLNQISLSSYLNTYGLLSGVDQVSAFHNHYVKETGVEGGGVGTTTDDEDVSGHELFAKINDSEKLIYAATAMKSNQFKSVFKAADEAAKQKNKDDAGNSVKVTEEDIKMNLDKVMQEGRFNSETLLNELAVQLLEPEIHIDHFLRVTSGWETLDKEDDLSSFEANLLDKPINLKSRLITCREELYNMVMPLRFRLQDQDSTPAVDVLTQQLLGVNSGFTRGFYEVCKFADMTAFQCTRKIIEKIKFDLEVISSEEGDHATKLINEWGRGVCFVSYVEIVRNMIKSMIELEIHAIDTPLVERTNLPGDEEAESPVPALTLYYYKGWYYGRSAGKNRGMVCDCFRTLLSRMCA
ncbi:ORF102 [Haliotid herpesvirus 1]|uniref:Uncharacterized protein n=1 Tax=Abalone herpesvirus Taiwan/2005 TaxID=1821058 RepID=A0A145VVW8_9VIRU|nr:hypothetical protein tc2005_p122 [Abalone herpesvirus Taiwan/2005]UCX57093.1 ORF102 [Haliotid herpesvirus 1]